MVHYLTEAERNIRRLLHRNWELGLHSLPTSTPYRFYIDDGEYDTAVVVGTAGPGLSWETVLQEAVRQFHRQRGDIQASWIRITHIERKTREGRAGRWAGHVRVTTSREEDLDVWVMAVNERDRE